MISGMIRYLSVIFLIALPMRSYSACSSPSGTAGQILYFSADLKFCDGSSWNSLNTNVTADTCTQAGAFGHAAGDLRFCNGSNWVSANHKAMVGTCSTGAGAITFDPSLGRMKWCGGSHFHLLGGGPPVDATVTFLGSGMTSANAGTYTFPAQTLGAAGVSRHIIVGVGARGASTAPVQSLTVAGITAEEIANFASAGSTVAFFAAHVPAGVTGDIVVTFTSGLSRMGYAVWGATNLQSMTPTAATTTGGTALLNVSAGGIALGINYDTYGTGSTWNVLTKDMDETRNDTGLDWHVSAASGAFAGAQTNLDVTNTVSGPWSNRVHSYISLR